MTKLTAANSPVLAAIKAAYNYPIYKSMLSVANRWGERTAINSLVTAYVRDDQRDEVRARYMALIRSDAPAIECKHNFVKVSDVDGFYLECTSCGFIKPAEPEPITVPGEEWCEPYCPKSEAVIADLRKMETWHVKDGGKTRASRIPRGNVLAQPITDTARRIERVVNAAQSVPESSVDVDDESPFVIGAHVIGEYRNTPFAGVIDESDAHPTAWSFLRIHIVLYEQITVNSVFGALSGLGFPVNTQGEGLGSSKMSRTWVKLAPLAITPVTNETDEPTPLKPGVADDAQVIAATERLAGESKVDVAIARLSEGGTRVPPYPKFALTKREFTTILERVGHAAATEDNRPILTCLNWIANGETLTVAAADGFVLATYTIPLVSQPFTWLLELEPLREMKFGKAKEIEIVQVSDDKITFNGMYAYMFPGKFPDIMHLIPSSFAQSFEVETAALREACERTIELTAMISRPVEYSRRKDTLFPHAEFAWSVDTLTVTPMLYPGAAEEQPESHDYPITETGVYGDVQLSAEFLLAALRHAPSVVTFNFNSRIQPIALTAPGWIHLQMPVNKQR